MRKEFNMDEYKVKWSVMSSDGATSKPKAFHTWHMSDYGKHTLGDLENELKIDRHIGLRDGEEVTFISEHDARYIEREFNLFEPYSPRQIGHIKLYDEYDNPVNQAGIAFLVDNFYRYYKDELEKQDYDLNAVPKDTYLDGSGRRSDEHKEKPAEEPEVPYHRGR